MKREIKVSFCADVEEKDIAAIKKAIDKYGAEIITAEMPELTNVGCFKLEVLDKE